MRNAGYPVDPRKPDMPDLLAFTGLVSAFRQTGFEEILIPGRRGKIHRGICAVALD